tara:strand:+ start:61 stop:765 length:705 start_codon:yes stop_codon:yes gene_type:complete
MAVYHKTPQDSNRDISRPNEIPPIAPPMPDNITGNIGNNFKVQELGKNFFQGEEMANQFAKKQMDKPVPPPGDPIGDQLGNMFMQPFSQKKIVKEPVPQPPRQEVERVPNITIKKIPERPRQTGYERIVKREMPSLQHAIEKPRMVPEKAIKTIINMNGEPKKYNAVNVQDLQDMGAVKEDKKGQYVVNENPQSVKDTLRFPKDTKHYSGKPYKPGQLIDETDFEEIIKKVNKS